MGKIKKFLKIKNFILKIKKFKIWINLLKKLDLEDSTSTWKVNFYIQIVSQLKN